MIGLKGMFVLLQYLDGILLAGIGLSCLLYYLYLIFVLFVS